MINEIVRDHFKISFTDPDKDGKMNVTLSFVDMVALTKRVQAWCGKVLALMEAEGVPGLSIDADRALPLFLNGTAPEAAAVLLIAEAKAAMPAPNVVSPAVAALADAWAVMDGKWQAFERERNGEIGPDDSGYTGHYEGYIAEAESMIGRLRRRGFEVVAADDGPCMHVVTTSGEHFTVRSGESLTTFGGGGGGIGLHRAPVEAADAHRAEAWEGTDLVTHLRSWPAAPPDCDAFSTAYAGDLMQKAADEIERLTTLASQLGYISMPA